MRTRICDLFGIEVPIFAFSRSPEVVAEVSRAGGMGVQAAISFGAADELERALCWIDDHVEGRPYGVDVVMPAIYEGAEQGGLDKEAFEAMIPERHRAFVNEILARHGVPELPADVPATESLLSWTHSRARPMVEVALQHPIRLLANALGPPPRDVIAKAHAKGIQVAALAGSVKHARAHVAAGVDVIVAQGYEAGGHTGEIGTFVLVPEIVDAVAPTPVLAAGGVGTGRHVAAALALGAEGVWTGSIWLTVAEADTHPVVKEKLLRASTHDTVRSKSMTGKPARQLKTRWTEAWDGAGSPGTLPMPLQFMLTAEAVQRMHTFAVEAGKGAGELLTSPVGQIVGRMNEVRATRDVVRSLVEEAREAMARLRAL